MDKYYLISLTLPLTALGVILCTTKSESFTLKYALKVFSFFLVFYFGELLVLLLLQGVFQMELFSELYTNVFFFMVLLISFLLAKFISSLRSQNR